MVFLVVTGVGYEKVVIDFHCICALIVKDPKVSKDSYVYLSGGEKLNISGEHAKDLDELIQHITDTKEELMGISFYGSPVDLLKTLRELR